MLLRTYSIAISLLSLNAVAESNIEYNCWDGSFAYNVASLVTTPETIEVGLKGSWFLGREESGLPINDITGIPLAASHQTAVYYLNFKRANCTKDVDGAFTCSKKAAAQFGMDDVLFVERSVDDLDNTLNTISRTYIDEVSVRIDKNGVKAVLMNDYGANIEPSTMTFNFDFAYCAINGQIGGTYFGDAYFPNRLSDYLAAPLSR